MIGYFSDWHLNVFDRLKRINYDFINNKIPDKKEYIKHCIISDNLSCHEEKLCIDELAKANMVNESLITTATEKIQPADRHVIHFFQSNIQNDFDELREEAAAKVENNQVLKRYRLGDMRCWVVEHYSLAITALMTHKSLLFQSWVNIGIFEPSDGSNDKVWRKKVTNCEKRKIKKSHKSKNRKQNKTK